MNLSVLLLLVLYTAIVGSLIWARFRFFRICPGASKTSSKFYDPIIVIHILCTYYYMLVLPIEKDFHSSLAAALYIISLTIFWWSIRTAKQLNFAFSDNVGVIITNGSYGLVRHPFYFSYILVF